MREWAYLHSELRWVYDHEVPSAYRDMEVDRRADGYSAWFMRSGEAVVETASGVTHRAGPGMWLLVPTERMVQRFTPDARLLSVRFECQWPSGENVLQSDGGLVFAGREHPALEERATKIARLIEHELPQADRNYYSQFSDYAQFLELHILFQQWLLLWFHIQRDNGADVSRLLANDDRLLRVLRCLNMAPLRNGIPHEALRRETGLGEAHLNRLLVAEHGMTVSKCWDQRRLKAAKSVLETGLMPIKEIAYSLGFRADSHFMTWFKRHTGMRPNEYRKTHRTLN